MSQSVTSGSFSRDDGPGGTTRKRRRTLSSPDRLGNTPAGVGSSPSFQAANSSSGCRLSHSENAWSWLQSGRKCLIIQRITLGKSVRLVVIYIYFTLVLLLKKSLSTLALNSKGWVQPQWFMYLEYVHVHENIFGCVWLPLFCIVFFTLRLPSSDLKYETAAHVCATTPHTDLPLSVSVYSCGAWVWECVSNKSNSSSHVSIKQVGAEVVNKRPISSCSCLTDWAFWLKRLPAMTPLRVDYSTQTQRTCSHPAGVALTQPRIRSHEMLPLSSDLILPRAAAVNAAVNKGNLELTAPSETSECIRAPCSLPVSSYTHCRRSRLLCKLTSRFWMCTWWTHNKHTFFLFIYLMQESWMDLPQMLCKLFFLFSISIKNVKKSM